MSDIDEAVAALRAGEPVVLPFDTVYGLAADPNSDEPIRRLYRLKGREQTQPTALVAASIEGLLECLPEIRETPGVALLPGQVTLVVPNPAHRFPWLTGTNPSAIGVRVPNLHGQGGEVLRRVGVVAATSANHPGGADPKTLAEVPEDIRAGAGAALDGGELAGTPSTVLDLTGANPRVLREGALPAAEALRRLGAPVRSS